jgi:chromosome segregation protein
VEAIVTSKPRDRRLLIEEAAGLGKHRKRRRRAQLKLERTEDNIARVLDVEREARSRLRPLKRQAEAAELHARLERQSLEAQLELARDAAGAAGRELTGAESAAATARERLDEAERLLAAVADRRQRAEDEFAEHSRRREALSARLFAARSAEDRIGMRTERAAEVGRRASAAGERLLRECAGLEAEEREAPDGDRAGDRIAALEDELRRVDAELAGAAEREVAGLVAEREAAIAAQGELEAAVAARRRELDDAEAAAEAARRARFAAEREVEAAIAFAEASPAPRPEEALEHVYAHLPEGADL